MKPPSELLNIVSCPVSGEKLEYNHEHNIVLSRVSGIFYPVIDGIPILLKKEARNLKECGIKIFEEAEELA